MQVHIKYGTEGLDLEFPETSNFKGILYPAEAKPLSDPAGAVSEVLNKPVESLSLQSLATNKKDAVIVIMATGNGLKDTATALKGIHMPVKSISSVEEVLK